MQKLPKIEPNHQYCKICNEAFIDLIDELCVYCRLEQAQKHNLILQTENGSLKAALNIIEGMAVAHHKTGPHTEKAEVRFCLRIQEIAAEATQEEGKPEPDLFAYAVILELAEQLADKTELLTESNAELERLEAENTQLCKDFGKAWDKDQDHQAAIAQLQARAEAAEAELAQLQAEAGAMREALENCIAFLKTLPMAIQINDYVDALKGNAGRALLEELARLREIEAAADKICKDCPCFDECDPSDCMYGPVKQLLGEV